MSYDKEMKLLVALTRRELLRSILVGFNYYNTVWMVWLVGAGFREAVYDLR